MVAGISRAMIFSKRVLLIVLSIKCKNGLENNQGAGFPGVLAGKATTEVGDDLVVEFLAASAPAFGADKLFDTAAQATEAQELGRATEFLPQFVAKLAKKHQLKAFARFEGQQAQVGFDDARPRDIQRGIGLHFEAQSAQDLFERLGEFGCGDAGAAEFALKVVENGFCGVLDEVLVDD